MSIVILVSKEDKGIFSSVIDDFYLHSDYPLLKVQGIYANLINLSTLFLPEDFTKALLRFYFPK